MHEPENPITPVFEAYRAAVFAKDVEAFISLYAQDVRVFDTWGRWSYDGVAAWREMVTEWFGSLGAERVAVELEEIQTIVAGDVAVAHAFITYQGRSAEGQALRAMQNRLTWALKLNGGAWQIVHEHTSAPVDPGTSKVILRR